MLFSAHPELSLQKNLYSTGWVNIAGDMSQLSYFMDKWMTSPIIWKGGVRKAANFDYADYIALDSDDGRLTLEMAIDEFAAYEHVIGTTKSHQLPKGNAGPCDRLRIYLHLDRRVDSLELYSYICLQLAKEYYCDLNPVDGARMYMPSKTVSIYQKGHRVNVAYYEAKMIQEKERRKEQERLQLESKLDKRRKFAGTRSLPRWVESLLRVGVPAGESRNKACFKVALFATEAGFTCEEIVEMIMASPIPVGNHVRLEVEQAVCSGAAKAIRF